MRRPVTKSTLERRMDAIRGFGEIENPPRKELPGTRAWAAMYCNPHGENNMTLKSSTSITTASPISYPFLWRHMPECTLWLRTKTNGSVYDVAVTSDGAFPIGHVVTETRHVSDETAWDKRVPSGSTVTLTQG